MEEQEESSRGLSVSGNEDFPVCQEDSVQNY